MDDAYESGILISFWDAHTLYERVKYFRVDVIADSRPSPAKLPKAAESFERCEMRRLVS